MPIPLDTESTLTDRYQTTVPDTVRKALGLQKRDKIRYTIHAEGQVTLSRVNIAEEDPVLGEFLHFLAEDMRKHPERIQALDTALADRIRDLLAGTDIDLDAPLSDQDD